MREIKVAGARKGAQMTKWMRKLKKISTVRYLTLSINEHTNLLLCLSKMRKVLILFEISYIVSNFIRGQSKTLKPPKVRRFFGSLQEQRKNQKGQRSYAGI